MNSIFCENYESVKTSSRGIFMLMFIKELHGGVCRLKQQCQVVTMHSILSASIYCIKLYSGKQNLYILFTTTFRQNFFDKKCVNYESKYGMYPIRQRTFYSFIESARPQESRVNEVWSTGSCHNPDSIQRLNSIQLRQ